MSSKSCASITARRTGLKGSPYNAERAVAHSDDRDHPFRRIATTCSDRSRPVWRGVLRAPLDDGGDVSLLWVGQARREAVPVVNRRDPRVTRSALTAGA